MLKLKATDRCAGIDFGLRTFASLYESVLPIQECDENHVGNPALDKSNEESTKIENCHYLIRSEKRLARLQRRLSRKLETRSTVGTPGSTPVETEDAKSQKQESRCFSGVRFKIIQELS